MTDRPWFKYYDKGVPTSLTYPDKPLFAFLEESAAKYPDKPAIHFKPAPLPPRRSLIRSGV